MSWLMKDPRGVSNTYRGDERDCTWLHGFVVWGRGEGGKGDVLQLASLRIDNVAYC